MRQPSETEIAYAAGFFDGEGYVTIALQTGKRTYYLRAGIVNSYQEPLVVLQDIWGGSLFVDKHHVCNRTIYRWYVHGYKASAFLTDVQPHLMVKSIQAALGIKFQSEKKPRGSMYDDFEVYEERLKSELLKSINKGDNSTDAQQLLRKVGRPDA